MSDGMNWKAVIAALRVQGNRDIVASVDAEKIYRDVNSAMLFKTIGFLAYRLADVLEIGLKDGEQEEPVEAPPDKPKARVNTVVPSSKKAVDRSWAHKRKEKTHASVE